MTVTEPTSRNSNEFRIWKAISIKIQNQLGRDLGSRRWDRHDTNIQEQWTNLGRKIGFALYNAPTIDPDTSRTCIFGYESEKEEKIKELREKALKLSQSHKESHVVWINFIFVGFWSSKFENMLPLIRVLKYNQNNVDHSYFMEPNGRTYDEWADFIDKNQLPECTICYPNNGWYTFDENGDCNLSFGKSAECDTSRQLVKGTDIGATAVGITGTVLAVVGLFTPLAPVAAATLVASTVTAGAYGAGRSTYALVDRATHGQSINPFTDKDSFFCWLGIIGAVVSLGATAATNVASSMAARGTQVGQFARIAATTAIFGSVGVNSVGVLAGFGNLIDKAVKGEDISPLEIFQLSASVLFLTNQVINVKTAGQIVKSVQQQRYDQIRPFLNDDQQKAFNQLIEQNHAEAAASGNARAGGEKTIRAVNTAFAEKNLNSLMDQAASAMESKAWQMHDAAENQRATNPDLTSGQYLKDMNQAGDMMKIANRVRGEPLIPTDTLKQKTVVQNPNTLEQKTVVPTLSVTKGNVYGQAPTSSSQIPVAISHRSRVRERQNVFNSGKFRSNQRQSKKQKYRDNSSSNSDSDDSEEDECICKDMIITVLYVNMHSVKPNGNRHMRLDKIIQLRRFMLEYQPQIIAIVESWLDDSIYNEEILSYLDLNGYEVFRQDRGDGHHPDNAYGHTTTGIENRRGGGILVLWKKPSNMAVEFERQPAEDFSDNAVNFDLKYTFQCRYCSNGQLVKKFGFTVTYRRPGPFANQTQKDFNRTDEEVVNRFVHLPSAYDHRANKYSGWAMVGDFNWNVNRRRDRESIATLISGTGVDVEWLELSSNSTHAGGATLDHVFGSPGFVVNTNDPRTALVDVTDLVSDHAALVFGLKLGKDYKENEECFAEECNE